MFILLQSSYKIIKTPPQIKVYEGGKGLFLIFYISFAISIPDLNSIVNSLS